jgi:type IX secretion system PorP/SprF family membrane protein
MKKIILVTITCVFSLTNMFSQDIHFTQFYASPLTLNPALAGVNDGTYRATAIYRNQWQSVTVPYTTYGASFDSRILPGKLKNNKLGVGVNFNADKSGTGKLFFMQAQVALAYNMSLDKAGKHFIGLGLQGGYVQKSLQYNLLSFPSQYNGTDFDLTLPNNEDFNANRTSYIDFNAGLLWHSQFGERIGAFAGFTYSHINRPKETFLGSNNKLSSRYTAHGGMKIKVTEKIYITPNFIYQYQNKAHEIFLGTGLEYHIQVKNIPMIFGLGGWYRLKDAGSVSIVADIKRIRAGFAYDINSSKLRPASSSRGAYEIFLTYTGLIGGMAKTLKPIQVPCPML